MPLTTKRIAFVEHYLSCWNATEAARRVGYAHPNMAGPRLMVDDGIKAYVEARLTEIAMSADMVLARLTALVSERDVITLRALELLGKHHKLFTERHEVDATHTVSDDVLDAIGGALKRGYGDGDAED